MFMSLSFELFALLSTSVTITYAAPISTSAPTNSTSLQQCKTLMNGALPNIIPTDFHNSGNVRRYYIAAEEETWDYLPSGWDNWLGVPLSVSPRARLAGYTAPGSLGTKWQKAVYRGYTDSTFTKQTIQESTHGIQGPLLRAEVGDMIEILFINKLPGNYASMHSMGLAYSKLNEGSLYPNYTASVKVDQTAPVGDAVPPGQCAVYKWLINDGSAPTLGAASHMWAYHSYVTMDNDLNAGLVGPTIVYPRGQMNATMASHREFTLLYMNFDESLSFMSATNAQAAGISNANATKNLLPNIPSPDAGSYSNYSLWHPQVTNLVSSSTLTTTQAPAFMSLNGRSLANSVPFEMCQDDSVIWYVYSVGSASHVFHMHGNGFTFLGQNKASQSLNNGVMQALPMTARAIGNWQLICHVNDHLQNGMEDPYVVYPADSCPLSKLAPIG